MHAILLTDFHETQTFYNNFTFSLFIKILPKSKYKYGKYEQNVIYAFK
jgi:hypothetical protein